MKIVLAPDSFKGSLTSKLAASALERGVRAVFADAQIVKVAVADGGEGTVDAVTAMCGGRIVTARVHGPLGDEVTARFGLFGKPHDLTAVIEMAEASGLTLVAKPRRDVRRADTFGTGELIRQALDAGVRRIVIGIGGSATNDGGAGMARALGVRFYDAAGQDLPPGGAALSALERIDTSGLDKRLQETEVLIASDVTNPLCGLQGCSAVYGPQKGASAQDVRDLDAALSHFGQIALRDLGTDIREIPGAGAAGGLGAGLMLFAGGKIRSGIGLILELIGFDQIVRDADLVITGEGFTDSQTLNGKAVTGIAAAARRHGCCVACLSGGVSQDAGVLLEHGIDVLAGVPARPLDLDWCMAHAAELLEEAAVRLCKTLAAGMKLARRSTGPGY